MAAMARLGGFTLDCPDPRALAAFYQQLTGWRISYDSDDYVFLDTGYAGADAGTVGVGFQRVADHRPPTWPGGTVPSQAHLDFYVDDLAQAGQRLEAIGATMAGDQPGDRRWHVYLDPAGHPLCVAVPGAYEADPHQGDGGHHDGESAPQAG